MSETLQQYMSDLALYRQYSLVLNGINDQMVKLNTELAEILLNPDIPQSEIISKDTHARDLMKAVLILRPTFEYFQQQKMLYYNKLDKKE